MQENSELCAFPKFIFGKLVSDESNKEYEKRKLEKLIERCEIVKWQEKLDKLISKIKKGFEISFGHKFDLPFIQKLNDDIVKFDFSIKFEKCYFSSSPMFLVFSFEYNGDIKYFGVISSSDYSHVCGFVKDYNHLAMGFSYFGFDLILEDGEYKLFPDSGYLTKAAR